MNNYTKLARSVRSYSLLRWPRRCMSSRPNELPNTGSPDTLQSNPREFFGEIKNVKTSVMKMNLVAKLIRKMSVGNALAQVQFCEKKAAQFVEMVLLETHKKAVESNADPLNLYVAESYVGRGECPTELNYHGRGHVGIKTNYHAHYFLTLKEGKPPKKKKSIEDSWKYRTRKFIQAGPRSIPNAL